MKTSKLLLFIFMIGSMVAFAGAWMPDGPATPRPENPKQENASANTDRHPGPYGDDSNRNFSPANPGRQAKPADTQTNNPDYVPPRPLQ